MFLERKVGDLSLWEFVVALIIIQMIIGMLVNFVSK
jgi:hypothetical protein